MQVKLLRVLQEKKITPVGSNQEIPVDVRIISATNKPLEKMMQEGKFRSDLYYRLNVMPINLQPLRERLDDIEDLSGFMIEKFNRLHDRQIRCLTAEVVQALEGYDWPGNIRELENVIEHAFIIEGTDEIHLDSLPPHIQQKATEITLTHSEGQGQSKRFEAELHTIEQLISETNSLKYPELKEQFEKEFIKRALKAFNGRINQTAEQTQMTKVTLLRKLEKYNINPKEFQH
jgi:transcriptional regulator with PAS, ATPase and Fis domain